MQSVIARRIVLALALSFVALFAIADDEPWLNAPLTADPKAVIAAAERVPAGESDVVVLLDEQTHTFDDAGRAVSTQRIVYRIVAESAIDSWSTLNAPWAPWYQEKPEIKARVITRDGTVHFLDNSAITEAPAPEESLDIFSDNRVIRAPLPAVAVGSVVEQVITHKQKSTLENAGLSDIFFFGNYAPVRHARVVLDAPAGLAIQIVNKTAPHIEPVQTEADGRKKIVVEAGPFPAAENLEWSLPFNESALPYIAFSTAKSWQDLAQRYAGIVDQTVGNGDAMKKIVAEAIGDTKDRREIIARALAYIQKHVRYAGVEIGESSIIPRAPQTVLGNRYGDCKDKATLLVAMLRAVGLDAHVALLRAGTDFDTIVDLPGLGMFNHAIVYVAGSDPLWVDPTDEFARAGQLPIMDQGRQALVADAKTTGTVTTPESESKVNRTVETRIFTLAEEGKAGVKEITVPQGADESSMRRYLVSQDKKAYRESMEKYAKGYYAAKELKDLSTTDPHDLARPFTLTLDITEAGRGQTVEGDAAVAIPVTGIFDALPWSLRDKVDPKDEKEKAKKTRRHDFIFAEPFVREWVYRIVPPAGFVARTLPQNETTQLGTAALSREYSIEKDGTVVASYHFDSGKRRLTASEFETLRKAITDLDDAKPVILGFDQIGQAKLNAGDVGSALTEFRKLAVMHPKEARHLTETARALLAGGMGDAAREQVAKAIKLEPNYARAWRMQGIILQHDTLGRPWRKGCDMPGALAAYRKAKELDPKDETIRAEYAKLLERGDDGLLFGTGAHLDDAIAEYRSLIKDLDQTEYEGELLLALAHARKFDELKETAKTVNDRGKGTLGKIIAAAATDGSAAAIREAASQDASEKKSLLRDAAGVLMGLRMYAKAADLLEEAMQGSPTTETRGQVEAIRKAKRYEEIELPKDDPKSIVRRLMIAELIEDLTDEKLATYFTKDEEELVKKGGHYTGTRAMRIGLVANARQQVLPMEFFADAGLANVQLTQDGDEKTGWRIRVRATGRRAAGDSDTYYVVKEGDEYKVSAMSKIPSLIGWSILRLVDAKNGDAARQWLNWLREDISAGSADDPLDGPPFARIWPKAKQSATDDEMRMAAAMLLYSKEAAPRGIAILKAARESATGATQTAIDQALAGLYAASEDYATATPILQKLHESFPESETGFNLLSSALQQLDRDADVEKLANDRLQKLPKNEDALRALAMASMHEGNYDGCEKYYRQLVAELTPNAGDYNNIAWNALLSGKDLERALEDARQAVDLPGANSALLHTLASLYAETGHSLEAREALLQSMDTDGREEPAPHDWYVLGRIAENYGAKDAALAAYKRVEKPKKADAASTYVLAERRLKVIAK